MYKHCFALFALFEICAPLTAQTGRVVLVEEFTETGCSACAQYDSAFQAITDANAGKIALLNYHCFYMLDPFYQYYKACDARYNAYKLEGYPCAMMNGKKPNANSAHQSFVTAQRINALYNQPELFKIDIASKSTGSDTAHSAKITVTAKALADNPSSELKLFVAITESNINYLERYGKASVNGVNEFNHILRAFLPDMQGTSIGAQTTGKTNTVKVDYANNEKEVNYKEVRIIAFIQDMTTLEVLGAATTTAHPFQGK